MNNLYGFEKECKSKYNANIFKIFSEVFNTLPIGHILGEKVLIVHGGLFGDDSVTLDYIQKCNRFRQPPENGPMNDILWSDPMENFGRAPSPRGVTKTFGPDITEQFLKREGLELLIRSHQVQADGFYVHHKGKCITVFSAPNYVGRMNNKGAIIILTFRADGVLCQPSFLTFNAQPIPEKYKPMQFASFGASY